jgi:hypothetical protein
MLVALKTYSILGIATIPMYDNTIEIIGNQNKFAKNHVCG